MCFKKVSSSFKEVSRVFERSVKGISGKFEGCFKEVSMKFQGHFKKVSRVFQGMLKGDSREFHLLQGYLKEVKGNSRDVSKVFQVCFREFLRVF